MSGFQQLVNVRCINIKISQLVTGINVYCVVIAELTIGDRLIVKDCWKLEHQYADCYVLRLDRNNQSIA
jgi:hypothetical protein